MSVGSAQSATGAAKSASLPWEGLVGFALLAMALYAADFCPAGTDANNQPLPSALHRDLAWLISVVAWVVFGLASARIFPSGVVGRARYFAGGIILGAAAGLAMIAAG